MVIAKGTWISLIYLVTLVHNSLDIHSLVIVNTLI